MDLDFVEGLRTRILVTVQLREGGGLLSLLMRAMVYPVQNLMASSWGTSGNSTREDSFCISAVAFAPES